ncbi:MAG: glycosyltransferase family 4 protein [Gemmatimonadaceae bacterium]
MTAQGSCRLGVVASHPIQYFTPLYRRLAATPGVHLEVLYCRDYGVREQYDKQFGRKVAWDTDQLSGYRHRFLRNLSPVSDTFNPLHAINPGVFFRALVSFDAIWVNGYTYPTNWIAAAGAAITGIPVLMRSELRIGVSSNGRSTLLREAIVRQWVRKSAALLYIGEENRRAYLAYGAKPEKMFFSPYSTDVERFAVINRRDQNRNAILREQWGLPRDKLIVLFVGKLYRKKHPESLLQLAVDATLRQKLHVAYAGTGAEEQALRDEANRQGMENVSFLGFVNQSRLQDLYGAADIFVMPSEGETWGLVLNEAMAAGLPAVVSDTVGAATDLIAPGETGLLFRSGDWKEMKRQVTALVVDEALRLRVAERGRERASLYSYDATVGGILAALQWLGVYARA